MQEQTGRERELVKILRAAAVRLRTCPKHLIQADVMGRYCSLCILEERTGKEMRSVRQIMEKETGTWR